MARQAPVRGELWFAYTPGQPRDPHQPRPVLVISADVRSRYRDDVVVIPIFARGVAAVVVFAISAVYYIAMRGQGAALGAAWAQRSRPPAWQVPLELGKSVVVALVVAGLVARLGITDPAGALLLGLALWIAFP